MPHRSAHEELARLLATGCPDEYAAAYLAAAADYAEEGRVLADRKMGDKGNGRLRIEWPRAAGRLLIPELVPARRPLLTPDPS